jgi:hypothetical protein
MPFFEVTSDLAISSGNPCDYIYPNNSVCRRADDQEPELVQWSRGPLSTPMLFLPTLISREQQEDNDCDANDSTRIIMAEPSAYIA